MRNLITLSIMIVASFTLAGQGCPGGGGGGGGTTTSLGGGGVISSQSFAGGGSSANFNALSGGLSYNHILAQSMSTPSAYNKMAYNNVDGSPYLNDESVKGTLVLNDGHMVTDILLQFNLHTNQAMATLENGDEIFLDSRYFREIIIPHNGLDVVFKKTNSNEPDRFYEVLYEDEGMLFFKERYASMSLPENNGIVSKNAKFRQFEKYFIRHGQGEIAKVKLKKKDIFSSFIDDEVYAMKEYAKKKGIKFDSEQDYVEVFEGVAAND